MDLLLQVRSLADEDRAPRLIGPRPLRDGHTTRPQFRRSRVQLALDLIYCLATVTITISSAYSILSRILTIHDIYQIALAPWVGIICVSVACWSILIFLGCVMVDVFDRFTIRAFLASFVTWLACADRLSVLWGRGNEPLDSWYLMPIEMVVVVSLVMGTMATAYHMVEEEGIQRYVEETLPALERDLAEMANWVNALSRDSNQADAWMEAKINWLRTPKTFFIGWNQSAFHIVCRVDSVTGIPMPRIQMGRGIGMSMTQMMDEETPRSEEEGSNQETQEGSS